MADGGVLFTEKRKARRAAEIFFSAFYEATVAYCASIYIYIGKVTHMTRGVFYHVIQGCNKVTCCEK